MLPALAPVHEMVRAQVLLRPEAIAMDGLTYRDLYAWAERIAASLAAQHVPAESTIAVRLTAGPEQVATLLGIMVAGCSFLPLGPAEAIERQIAILTEIRPSALVVAQVDEADELIGWFRDHRRCPVLTPLQRDDQATDPAPPFAGSGADLGSLVYVVYTSGSTGRPKGIAQSHRGLAQFVSWMGSEFRMGHGRRIAQWASPNYDAAFCEIFSTLVSGGTLCPVPEGVRIDAGLLVRWLADNEIQLLQTVPSYGRELLHVLESGAASAPQGLDHLLLAGEALQGDLATGLRTVLPGLRLANLYGATETILATWMEVTGDWPGMVPIGHAIPGREVLVLDTDDRCCPVGVTGEIVIRSPYLTLGYVGSDRIGSGFGFVTLPDDDPATAAVPCYRTGDLGVWRADGLLEFRGRRDRQVKLRGVRVELSDIEAALASHESVLDCVVVPTDGDDGSVQSLIAYVVPASMDGTPDLWRAHLKRKVNEQMLPSIFITMASLPRNAGGKVDRTRLPSPTDAVARSPIAGGSRRRLVNFRSWSGGLKPPDGGDTQPRPAVS